MRDREVVAAIVAGDPAGLAEAYDRYATPLYSFCRTMLREPADAADAVQDTFVIAAPRMAGLRDPERLRSWLYAVARNECHRRLRAGSQHASIEEAPDVTDEAADVAADVERADLRALVRDALGGVGPAEREVLELQLRQGLSGGEVASVLGISRNHAHALLSRARDQLETSLGALVVARTGRQDCAELDAMLQAWDGALTVLVRKRVNRHVERCAVCSGRRRREVSPATLLGIAPIAALPLLAGALPAGFRDQVLRLATGHSPAAGGSSGCGGEDLVLVRPSWFSPPPSSARSVLAAPAAGPRRRGGRHRRRGRGGRHLDRRAAAPRRAAGRRRHAGRDRPRGFRPRSRRPDRKAQGQRHGAGHRAADGHRQFRCGGPAAEVTAAPVPVGASSATATASPGPGAGTSTGDAPGTGTLSVSPATLDVAPPGGGSITLTASGGTVNWSVSEPPGLEKKVVVAPVSGTLAAGQTAAVSVTVRGPGKPRVHLTFVPGGAIVTVVIS